MDRSAARADGVAADPCYAGLLLLLLLLRGAGMARHRSGTARRHAFGTVRLAPVDVSVSGPRSIGSGSTRQSSAQTAATELPGQCGESTSCRQPTEPGARAAVPVQVAVRRPG
ncbi:hypothetical protein [Streptomyces sp. JNUCC 63]